MANEKRALVTKDPAVWVFEDSGVLKCTITAHQKQGVGQWCSHIKTAVQGGMDSDWIFTPGHLIVPMFPTYDLFSEVRIEETIIAGGRKLLVPVQTGGNFTADLDFVGFISPGEGRRVVRTMLIDWARNNYRAPGDKEGLQCRSKMHGMEAERALKQDISTSYQAAVMWSVVTDGLCLHCWGRATNSNDSFADGI